MPIRLSPGNWGSSVFNIWVATILLNEQLQIPAEIVQYEGEDLSYFHYDRLGPLSFKRGAYSFPAVERGSHNFNCSGYPRRPTIPDEECSHGMLEIWSGQNSNKQKYITRRRSVENAGVLESMGRIGWYTNTYILDIALEMASYRGLSNANRTAALFKKPLSFQAACEAGSAARLATNGGPSAALCTAFAAEFLQADGSAAPKWEESAGIDGPSLWGAYFIQALPAEGASALAARLGVSALPVPLYAGAFTTDVDVKSGLPIGHLIGVPCDWTSYEAQITSSLGLALQVKTYPYGQIMQVLQASEANAVGVLFYWWEPSGVVARDATHTDISTLITAANSALTATACNTLVSGVDSGRYTRLTLPPPSDACESKRVTMAERCDGVVKGGAGCDYPIEVIYKALSTSVQERAPLAHTLLKALSISTDDQLYFIRRIDADSAAARDAACDWVVSNEAKWRLWLAPEEWLAPVCAPVQLADGTSVTCGFNGGGTCARIDPLYPDGRCACHANHQGKACEACADGFETNPRADTAAAGFQCVVCDASAVNNTYAIDCGENAAAARNMLIAVVGSVVALALLLLAWRQYHRHMRYREAAAAAEANTKKRIRDAVNMMQQLSFPFCLVRFSTFKQMGRLVTHEEARDSGSLLILDTWADAIAFGKQHACCFNSHQWLAYREPDPKNVHYPAMVAAGEGLCAQQGIAEDALFMWVDVLSIPQANVNSKLAAINTIAVYACCCEYFVACVPSTMHADAADVSCNAETYLRRGWCRLEQWAFMSVHGTTNMYMSGDGITTSKRLPWKKAAKVSAITTAWMGGRAPPARILPAEKAPSAHGTGEPPPTLLIKLSSKPGWLSQSIKVMDGDFTVPEDRTQLVDVVLGLYAFTAVTGEDEGGLQQLIDDMKDAVFPKAHFGNLVDRLESELERARKGFSTGNFSASMHSVRSLLKSPTPKQSVLFKNSDFESMLNAKEAFLEVHGKGLAPELKHKLAVRAESEKGLAARAEATAGAAIPDVSEVEHVSLE